MGAGCFMGPGRLKGARFVIGFPKLKNGTDYPPLELLKIYGRPNLQADQLA